MSSVLVVGSVVLDSIETPVGKQTDLLGGSACYASLAAALMGRAHLLGVVGSDFPVKYRRLLEKRGVNTKNLMIEPGKTFRWSGYYEDSMAVAHSRETCLNVFEQFRPKLLSDMAQIPYVFLGNIDPELQLSILDQLTEPRFVACDTMNYWIERKKDALEAVFRRVNAVLMNAEEIRQYTGETSLMKAAHVIHHMGPSYVVIKKGEHGAVLTWPSGMIAVPGYPVSRLVDPTGAGDTFAGGLVGWVAKQKRISNRLLTEACVVGTAMASFTCEGFGIGGLVRASIGRLIDRCNLLRHITTLPPVKIRQ